MEVLALAAVAGGSALAAWLADRRRSRRRNALGACGMCATSWSDPSSGEPHVIHGQLVCEACAEKAKRRVPWELGALGAASAVATGFVVAGQGLVAMVILPVGATIVMTVAAAELMKLANRNAQRRIAGGDHPEYDVVASERSGSRAAGRLEADPAAPQTP